MEEVSEGRSEGEGRGDEDDDDETSEVEPPPPGEFDPPPVVIDGPVGGDLEPRRAEGDRDVLGSDSKAHQLVALQQKLHIEPSVMTP